LLGHAEKHEATQGEEVVCPWLVHRPEQSTRFALDIIEGIRNEVPKVGLEQSGCDEDVVAGYRVERAGLRLLDQLSLVTLPVPQDVISHVL
jgi:hypothetical protein